MSQEQWFQYMLGNYAKAYYAILFPSGFALGSSTYFIGDRTSHKPDDLLIACGCQGGWIAVVKVI